MTNGKHDLLVMPTGASCCHLSLRDAHMSGKLGVSQGGGLDCLGDGSRGGKGSVRGTCILTEAGALSSQTPDRVLLSSKVSQESEHRTQNTTAVVAQRKPGWHLMWTFRIKHHQGQSIEAQRCDDEGLCILLKVSDQAVNTPYPPCLRVPLATCPSEMPTCVANLALPTLGLMTALLMAAAEALAVSMAPTSGL